MLSTGRERLHRVDSGHSRSVSPLTPPRQVPPFYGGLVQGHTF
jgi:hypothetical protein